LFGGVKPTLLFGFPIFCVPAHPHALGL